MFAPVTAAVLVVTAAVLVAMAAVLVAMAAAPAAMAAAPVVMVAVLAAMAAAPVVMVAVLAAMVVVVEGGILILRLLILLRLTLLRLTRRAAVVAVGMMMEMEAAFQVHQLVKESFRRLTRGILILFPLQGRGPVS